MTYFMNKSQIVKYFLYSGCIILLVKNLLTADPVAPVFNRGPLTAKPYAELPLGAIQPEGWLQDELQRMADGMSGHLDEWYPEVCGDRNAWLGGDGDTWERGPYWINGLYPLAKLLGDEALQAKAQRWVDWTLENQHPDGYIGPVGIKKEDHTRPAPPGAQINKPDDWWPRMVMLKILQQHYMATGDERVVKELHNYFHYQLNKLPGTPLHDPDNPDSGSWWAAERGGDNLMVVLWFYNLTGEPYLLELANLIYQQTIPVTDWFENGNVVKLRGDQSNTTDRISELKAFHCVNLAQAMKTPLIRSQQDGDPRHMAATRKAFEESIPSMGCRMGSTAVTRPCTETAWSAAANYARRLRCFSPWRQCLRSQAMWNSPTGWRSSPTMSCPPRPRTIITPASISSRPTRCNAPSATAISLTITGTAWCMDY